MCCPTTPVFFEAANSSPGNLKLTGFAMIPLLLCGLAIHPIKCLPLLGLGLPGYNIGWFSFYVYILYILVYVFSINPTKPCFAITQLLSED